MSPARALSRDRDLGALEIGKLAHLVILDADPLTDIRNIVKVSRVIKGGNVHEPAQLIEGAR
jgi:imidazolonepropionase-like amidohydrolase